MKMDLQHSFYNMYDRLGEDVYYQYTIEYDWDSILKNGFNKDNFKVVPVGFSEDYDSYFSRYAISKKKWEKNMKDYLLSEHNDTTQEAFFENLTEKQNKQYDLSHPQN